MRELALAFGHVLPPSRLAALGSYPTGRVFYPDSHLLVSSRSRGLGFLSRSLRIPSLTLDTIMLEQLVRLFLRKVIRNSAI